MFEAALPGASTEYRCLFVYNTHPTVTLQNTRVFLAWKSDDPIEIVAGLDRTGVVPAGSHLPQAGYIPNSRVLPESDSSVLTPYLDRKQGLYVGHLPAGHCIAIWVGRIIPSGDVVGAGMTIRVEGEVKLPGNARN